MKFKQNTIYSICLSCASILFLLLFMANTSPLYRNMCGGDMGYFIITGRWTLSGMLPYIDFFDIKGPILFYLYAFSQFIHPDKIGVFILEIPFLITTVLFTFKSALFFLPSKKAFWATFSIFFIALLTFSSGGLTEELCLPFIAVSIFLALKSLNTDKYDYHNPMYAFIYGVCFAIIIFIKMTNAAAICAIVLFFTILLIKNKNYKNLFFNALYLLAGVLVISLPIMIYFAFKNALWDMLYCTFVFPLTYGGEGLNVRSFVGWLHYFIKSTPIIVTIFMGILYYLIKRKNSGLLLSLMGLLTAITTFGGYNYIHYFTLIAPLFVIALSFFIEIYKEISLRKHAAIHICISVSIIIMTFYYGFAGISLVYENAKIIYSGQDILHQEKLNDFIDTIPQEERNSLYFYNAYSNLPYIMNTVPYNKYSDFQDNYAKLNPDIKNEIINMMEQTPPKWVITYENDKLTNTSFLSILESDYDLVKTFNEYNMYVKK